MLLFDIFGKSHKIAEQKDIESIKVGGCFGRVADVWIRDVQLEKGNMCTDYVPAYQDILRRIQLLESATLGGGKILPSFKIGGALA